MGFVNFHVHSEYSFRSSFLSIEEITRYSAENGFDGCSVTDTNCVSGFIELSARASEYGMKPVFGCQLIVKGVSGRGHYPVLLIALDRKGLLNLYGLASETGRDNYSGMLNPIPLQDLILHREGLAVLAFSEIYAYRNDSAAIKKICGHYTEAFGLNFFLEMNYIGDEKIGVIREMVEIAGVQSLKPIASSEARYIGRDRADFNMMITGTTSGDLEKESDYSLKDAVSIKNHFKNHPDYLDNAAMLLDRIENNLIARRFPMPEYKKGHSRLKKICESRLSNYSSDIQYSERLAGELKIISSGLSSYFLIAYELSCFMKKKGIAYGPGKGPFPSSLVLFLLGFTKIDPVKYGLVFELLAPPGTDFLRSMELDIARKKQRFLFSYINSRFGPRCSAYMTTILRWTRAAGKFEGRARGLETETGSVALVGENIAELAPLYPEGVKDRYSGLTGNDADFSDFLRIEMKSSSLISIIEEGFRSAGIKSIDYDDRETYLMIKEGRTNSIFILENFAIREYLRSSAVDSMRVLCDIIAIYRKGPITDGTALNYITRRMNNQYYGKASPQAHETSPITWDTYGLILYEEQVLLIAHEAAGMDWNKSLMFLKAIVKRDNQAILRVKDEFIRGCIDKGSGEEPARRLFGILIETGSWAVKKSQTLGYAYTAYSLAYLKTHSPVDFYLASLNNNMYSTDKLNRILIDLMIEQPPGAILPVDINRSRRRFSKENGKIRAGLEMIKHLGHEAAGEIVMEREKNGVFKDMLDFAIRMTPLGLHEKALLNLVKAGAFRDSGFETDELLACAAHIFKFASREGNDKSLNLFEREEFIPDLEYFIKNCRDVEKNLSPMAEFEATEAYLSNHPLDMAEGEIKAYNVDYLDSIHDMTYGTFIVYMFQLRIKSKSGGMKGADAVICDKKGMAQVIFVPSIYKHYSSIIRNHTIYLLKGSIKGGQVFAEQVYLFEELGAG